MNITPIIAAALAALTLALATPLAAQETITPTEITAEQVTDEQVAGFVEALVAIEKLRVEFAEKMLAQKTDEDRKAVAEEADAAAMQAIKDAGSMTAEEYLGIAKAARENKALNQRINARIKEMQAG